jgi:hypothetical protein
VRVLEELRAFCAEIRQPSEPDHVLVTLLQVQAAGADLMAGRVVEEVRRHRGSLLAVSTSLENLRTSWKNALRAGSGLAQRTSHP